MAVEDTWQVVAVEMADGLEEEVVAAAEEALGEVPVEEGLVLVDAEGVDRLLLYVKHALQYESRLEPR